MDCKDISRMHQIDKYILDELPGVEKENFEKHIFECDFCFQDLKLRKEMLNLIKEEGDVLFPEFLATKNKPAKEKETKQKLKGILHKFKHTFTSASSASQQEKLIPVYIMTALFFIVISSIFIYQNYFQLDFNSSFCYDEVVPYEYRWVSQNNFRSGENPKAFYIFDSFNSKFEQGILEYGDRNYQKAIHIWEALLPDSEKLQGSLKEIEPLSILRDYHFYLGVSYLAKARSKNIEIPKGQRQISYQNSTSYLLKSKNFTVTHKLNFLDRDLYFLALAYGFSGDVKSAVSELHKIKPESQFNPDASKLMKEWNRK